MADLSQMSLDEFMDNWDSDGPAEDAQVDDPAPHSEVRKSQKKSKTKKGKKETKAENINTTNAIDESHQQQLNKLKEKDPEFYKFLQAEDSSLLQFNGDDFDLDDSSDEDSDSGIHKLPAKLEEVSDSDIESDDEMIEANESRKKNKGKDPILVSVKMLEEWKVKLIEDKSSFPALREVLRTFRAAVLRFTESDESDEKKSKKPMTKYKVLSSEIFNAIVGLCMQQVVPSLAKILNISLVKQSSNNIRPQKSKSWDKVRDVVQYYLCDVIMLNQLLLEPLVLCAALRHTILLIPYYLCFPKITKQLLKFLIKTWGGFEDETVRILSFLCINRIAKLDSDKYLEIVLKQCYLEYVSNCKFTTPTLLPMINFLQQTLCELFAIKPQATYPIAFLYIRQLAIHLRKAMMVPKKENFHAVYNWQFIHCIGLWSRMVSNMSSVEVIKPLLYPLVQVSLGTIDLLPTARYFPLRYRVIKDLIALMDRTGVYIPLLPYITKPIQLAEFSKKSGMITEPLNFATMLRLSNSQLKENSYRSTTMDEMYDTLMGYLNTQAHTISFPEMIVPTLMTLKKFIKGCKVAGYSKPIQQLLYKIDENSKFIMDSRSKVAFGVSDVRAVNNWELSQKNGGVPFHKHFNNYKRSRQVETRHLLADKNRNVEERLPQIDRKKFIELAKAKDREEFSELFGGVEDVDFSLELQNKLAEKEGSVTRKKRMSKKRKMATQDDAESADRGNDSGEKELVQEEKRPRPTKKKEVKEEDEEPDVVEDFCFSSDED